MHLQIEILYAHNNEIYIKRAYFSTKKKIKKHGKIPRVFHLVYFRHPLQRNMTDKYLACWVSQ